MDYFGKNMIKDIGISLLIVTAISLVTMILFYNKISLGRVLPTVEEYQLSEEMQNEIDIEEKNETMEVVKTYKIKGSDLNKYEKTKEYNKGKKDPFAAAETGSSKSGSGSTGKSSGGSSSSDSDTDDETESKNASSNNFYEDDGTK